MPVAHCVACGGTDFYRVRLPAKPPAHRIYLGGRKAYVTATVCLTCGGITHRVEGPDLEMIRRWKKDEERFPTPGKPRIRSDDHRQGEEKTK